MVSTWIELDAGRRRQNGVGEEASRSRRVHLKWKGWNGGRGVEQLQDGK